MIYEINRARINPASYLSYLVPMLKDALELVHNYGRHYKNEEGVNALSTRMDYLKNYRCYFLTAEFIGLPGNMPRNNKNNYSESRQVL